MRIVLRLLALMAALAILMPTLTAQEKDKEKPKTDPKDNPAKLPKYGPVKLVNPGSEKGNIVISVQEPYLERSGRNIVTKFREKHVDLAQADEMIVRRANPPIMFDDKGKARKPTNKELKEMKGEGHLPGYMAEASDLKANQIVTVYYQAKKKPANKDDADALTDNKPKVRMIVIEREAQ
jgi:hypothetical protein